MKKIYTSMAVSALATGAVASSLLFSQITSENQGNTPAESDNTVTAEAQRRAAGAQDTDVTSQYIKNPSFELDNVSSMTKDTGRNAYVVSGLNSWTLTKATSGYAQNEIMTDATTSTDNNYGDPGKPSNGYNMLYIRNSWTKNTASVKQSVKLPAGSYKLTVDSKCVSTAANHSINLVAGGDYANLPISSTMPSAWRTSEITFTLSNEATIDLGVVVNFENAAGLSVLLDNFHLYSVASQASLTENDVPSYTEGVINNTFVPEATMQRDLLQMLADFSKYLVNDFQECQAPNSINEKCGCFRGENSLGSDERGVRPNADLSMVCAFLVKYAKPAGIQLPSGITYDKIEDMARKSLVFAYSTHKANKLKVCNGGKYWGSTSTSDFVWESSLWAMSVAYSAYFQWDKLSSQQKNYIKAMLVAECNYELYRGIPTGYAGDTKAEENGWEADILAATLGLFPDDALASKWFDRMREMAINSYSHPSDATNRTVIDSWYNNKTVADLYRGQNLYDDYSLQNHNLFHTSYQNVVMQELGEAALALKMFQKGIKGTEKWKSNALMHNNQQVQDNILNWLALADGELAMPNGNDWSLFLYDQITSYTTQACFQRDPNALMLENLAYKYIKARQKTTTDGSWLLRADVGARRMGVEAHRVMMTYLMHDQMSTADMTPTSWDAFNKRYSEARLIPCQNVVRASSDYRFTCFSWSTGLKSYTGYFASNSADKNKIVVPYRANNTGNITGWYEVSGKVTDASPVVSGIYQFKGNSYVMNGELNCNGGSLNNRFALYSTPKNALIYLDYVTANANVTITAEKGGLLAISTDELMKTQRTLYYGDTRKQTDGSSFFSASSNWVNIDNELGVIGNNNKKIAFGDRGANNSIYTSKLYPMYSNASRNVTTNSVVDARNLVYYSLINADKTKAYANALVSLRGSLPTGWNGVIAPDENTAYMLISNFKGQNSATVSNIAYNGKAPVFNVETSISSNGSSATFNVNQNNSYAQELNVLVKASNATAKLEDDGSAIITAKADQTITVSMSGAKSDATINAKNGNKYKVYLSNGNIVVESKANEVDLTGSIINPSFNNGKNGWAGDPVVNYSCAEKWNVNGDVYQTISGLQPGKYIVTCQGFYREGDYVDAVKKYNSGTETINAFLYANGYSTPLKSIFADANKAGTAGINTSGYYIPNTMQQTEQYFNKGLYKNTLECYVGADGVLTIGVRKPTTVLHDWVIFDNFTLTLVSGESESNVIKQDVTGVIVNPTFNGNSKNGWAGDPVVNYGCAEKWNVTANISQTIYGLNPGKYILTCQGFYREGDYADAAIKHNNGTETINAFLYANGYSTPLKSIFADANKAGSIGVSTSGYWVPNTMQQADQYFSNGLYNNTLECYVGADGILKIGINKPVTVLHDWVIFDNFTLTYVTSINEARAISSLDYENQEEATAITTVKSDNAEVRCYNMAGQRVDPNTKGIVIINGRKYINK